MAKYAIKGSTVDKIAMFHFALIILAAIIGDKDWMFWTLIYIGAVSVLLISFCDILWRQ